MSWIQTRRRAQEAPAGHPMEDTLRRQMAWAAGTEQFQHRDPLYHVTESFQQTFDAIGCRHAQELAGGRTEEGAEERADQTSGENQMPDQTSARSFYERSRPEDQDMVRRFSETAFQRGTLSGAVLEGTGQMMYRAGAIQKGDPGYEEFLDDLYYAGGVCAYVLDLRNGGKAVEEGDRSLGEVDTFEEGLERGKANVRSTLKL